MKVQRMALFIGFVEVATLAGLVVSRYSPRNLSILIGLSAALLYAPVIFLAFWRKTRYKAWMRYAPTAALAANLAAANALEKHQIFIPVAWGIAAAGFLFSAIESAKKEHHEVAATTPPNATS